RDDRHMNFTQTSHRKGAGRGGSTELGHSMSTARAGHIDDHSARTDRLAQFIYTMHKVRKAHGDKVILDDVTLSFLPGAKIGVVGPNGAGKSSVLKIMAGLDQASNGEARLSPGASVGLLQQEPPLDETKTVR